MDLNNIYGLKKAPLETMVLLVSIPKPRFEVIIKDTY
jgi:hypothetical protein